MLLLHLVLAIVQGQSVLARTCRAIPGDEAWPSTEAWNDLNGTVEGRLIALTPATMLGAVCHDPQFNATACALAKSGWQFPEFHFPNPSSFMMPFFQNNSCDPFTPRSQPCVLGDYADYSINVTGPADIASGIKFASEKNIRLVIKNTGHDYLGKSTGKGSLSLWTHNLKSIQLLSWSSDAYTGAAVKMGAGIQAYEAYAFAHDHGLRVLGGECPTVGLAGGWTTGAGHSALSSTYGLGADQALEWEVVLANGSLVLANPTHNPDLYWALNGGGGGTYGVQVSLTVKAHADGPVGGAFAQFQADGPVYWQAVEAWHASLPALVDSGAMAVYALSNTTFNLVALTAPDKSRAQTLAILNPFLARLHALNVSMTVLNITEFPNFYEHVDHYFGPLPYGPWPSDQLTAGRLIPRSVVLENNTALTDATRTISNMDGRFQLAGLAMSVSHEIAGNTAESNAVLPAWRTALISITVQGVWDAGATLGTNDALERQNTAVVGTLLQDLAPLSGTYLNEADFADARWQQDFYGANYARLRAVKAAYDAESLFYARTAVGSDEYGVDGAGRLCRVDEGGNRAGVAVRGPRGSGIGGPLLAPSSAASS